MNFLGWLFGESDSPCAEPIHDFNPASGLPMLNDAVDVGGNLFGTDFDHHTYPNSTDCASVEMTYSMDFDNPTDLGCDMHHGYASEYGCIDSIWD